MSLEIRNERDDLRMRVKELEYQLAQLQASNIKLREALCIAMGTCRVALTEELCK